MPGSLARLAVLVLVAAAGAVPAAAAPADIVIHPALVAAPAGSRWTVADDPTAVDGRALVNPNLDEPKLLAPLAAPESYVDLTFVADAATPYHVWFRMKAYRDNYYNDSVYLQFSDTLGSSGAPDFRIGSTRGLPVILEEGIGAYDQSWGWNDNSYGGLGTNIVFATSGMHTMRIQQREDGVMIDQIVLSPANYLETAPGAAKNDLVLLPPNPPLPTVIASAASATIFAGRGTSLAWSSTDATSVTVDPAIGDVATTGTVPVSPSATTTYTVTARGPGGAAVTSVTIAVVPTFTVANWNIRSGQGICGSLACAFDSTTNNCTNAALPRNAWAHGIPQAALESIDDSRLILIGLQEAWNCGSPENVRAALGWAYATPALNGTAFVAKYGIKGTYSVKQIAFKPVDPEPNYVLGADVCLDAPCERTVRIYVLHLGGVDVNMKVQLQTATDWIQSRDHADANIIVGDFNVWDRTPAFVKCGAPADSVALPVIRAAGYLDAWEELGLGDGPTGMTNRKGYGSPNEAPFKRIDYEWTRGFAPIEMSRFAMSAPGAGAASDHFGIVTEYSAAVVPAPARLPMPQASLAASSSAIDPGTAVTLTWDTANVTSAIVNNGIGRVSPTGTVVVSPAMTTTYLLTAVGPIGPATASVTVTVRGTTASTAKAQAALTASAASIPIGGSVTLTWSTKYAYTAAIDHGVGAIPDSGSVTVSPTEPTTYTLVVTNAAGTVTTATATVMVTPTSETGGAMLPAGWQGTDIGAVGLAGASFEEAGVFTLSGAGADVWGSADAARFVWHPLNGDGSITAQVTSVSGTQAWAKAGVMIRATTDPGSPQAFMLVSVGKGIAFQRRTIAGGASTSSPVAAGVAPKWVRLSRLGAVITASVSDDGVEWVVVGSDTFAIAGPVQIGLAVSSHDPASTAIATFDHVE